MHAAYFSQVALLQAFLGDDVHTAVSGLGLVRALELVTSVGVPQDVNRAIRRAQDDRDDEEPGYLKPAVTTYVRLVFVRLLTERWAGPKQDAASSKQRAGGKAAVGRFKFSVSGVTRGPAFDATTAVTSDPRLTELIGAYVGAIIARAFPSRDHQGERVNCEAGRHPPPHPHLSLGAVSATATGGVTFGKEGAGRWGGAGAGLGTGPGNSCTRKPMLGVGAGDGSEWKAGVDSVLTEPAKVTMAHIMRQAERLLYGARSPTRTEAAKLAGMFYDVHVL